jgi:hypothetical protein
MMTIEWLRRTFRRDLASLAAQLDAYPDELSVWKAVPGMANSGGTLAMHLVGNMRHFIGAQLGGSGYVRDRDAEFGARDVSRTELKKTIAAAQGEVDSTLAKLDPATLDNPYPLAVAGVTLSTGQFLVNLGTHFGYHLGQLDYHRRVVTGGTSVAGMQSPKALADPAV